VSARVAVIGAGVAGLVTAWRIEQQLPSAEVVLFEATDVVGGKVRSTVDGDFVIERGPNGFLNHEPAMTDLVQRLGLEPRQRRSQQAARRRYLVLNGGLVELPRSPAGLFTTPILSPWGRFRVLLEPLFRAQSGSHESIHAFVSRRFGVQAAEMLADPMVKGVFGGDSRNLSMAACFPKVAGWERDHGSVLRGAMASRGRSSGGSPVLSGFLGGMQDLTDAVSGALRSDIRLSSPVRSMGRGEGVWNVEGDSFRERADVVVDASPAWAAAEHAPGEALRGELAAVAYAPMVVVTLAWSTAQMERRPVGFGALAPSSQGLPYLGVLWSSQIFPSHTADGVSLLRFMTGGEHARARMGDDDEALVDFAVEQLAELHGLRGAPVQAWVTRWPRAIPQYELGHLGRLARINQLLSEHPGLYLTGSAYRGVSVIRCVAEAVRVADDVVSSLV